MDESKVPGAAAEFLQRRASRISRQVSRLEQLSDRFSWYRLAVVLAGGGLTLLAGAQGGWAWSRWALGFAVLAFTTLVFVHRRVDRWRFRFTLWRDFLHELLARQSLDWPGIPQPPSALLEAQSRLQVDLDLTGPRSLHHLLCLAVSRQGSQRLEDWLSGVPPSPEEISKRQRLVRELSQMKGFRRRLILAFREVQGGLLEGQAFADWLSIPVAAGRLGLTLSVASFLALVNLGLFFLSAAGMLPPYWPLTLGLYLLFTYLTLAGRQDFLDALLYLDAELDKFRAVLHPLETTVYTGSPELANLAQPFWAAQPRPSVHLRRIKLATAGVGLRTNPVLGAIINLFVPWDIACAYIAARLRARLADLIPLWLDRWYQLEASLSLAEFAELNPDCAFPIISAQRVPVFQARDLGHPLLPPGGRVCNDFIVPDLGELVVVTGSNMSGKSTFIKTVGINLCMAFAGGAVQASELRTTPFRLHSCIQIQDSLVEGFSYFYAEVRCLRRLLDSLEAGLSPPLLYLVDEIFRGTNNRERMIGSRAIVRHLLGRPGVGLLATHDLELAALAEQGPGVRNIHFRDRVEDGRLVFDYKLYPGPSNTTNALKIMAMEGLPLE